MKRIMTLFLSAAFIICLAGCSSTKNATDLKASRANLSGTWVITDVAVDMPENYKVTNVFDEAPSSEFLQSTWNLVRNGKGSYTLASGTTRQINWSIYTKGEQPEFQFKKLMGEKARNVEEGYRLTLGDISNNQFMAQSIISAENGSTGTITYTFQKK